MRNMKKMIILIIAILSCVSFVVVANNKEYNYTMKGSNGITEEQVGGMKSKIDKIYEYFDKKDYELKEVKYIVSDYTRLTDSENEIEIDFKNISDFELMQVILQYEFSDYLNYGLMYGVMYDISRTYGFEFEDVTTYNIEDVEEHWDYMFLSYINFTPEIASETEIKISKYVATELVSYILDNHGGEYLFDLMKKSSDLQHTNKINEVLDEWMINNNNNNNELSTNKIVNREIFNLNSRKDTIEFTVDNINWVLNLNNEEMFPEYFANIYDNTQTFYDYMNIIYDEITRLEEVLDFDSSELPSLTIEVYTDIKWGGFYDKNRRTIEFNSISTFSHEFVHFIDDCFNRRFKYAAYGEMRAVYYSREFLLWTPVGISGEYEYYLEKINQSEQILISPVDKVENYLGRKMTDNDYYLLFNDLLIQTLIESGQDIPKLFDIRGAYPIIYWYSIIDYIGKAYGDGAFETIMFDEKLPDGTMKTITLVIEEWKIYITNLSEYDYDNYYLN